MAAIRHDYDLSEHDLTAKLRPSQKEEGGWVLIRDKLVLPVLLTPEMLEDVQANPKTYKRPRRYRAWLTWDWEKDRPQIVVCASSTNHLEKNPRTVVRGLIARVEGNNVSVLITPAKGKREPFIMPLVADEQTLPQVTVGERAIVRCRIKQGKLLISRVFPIEQPQTALAG